MPLRHFAATLIEHGRATEWVTSAVLLGFAIVLALPGDTLSGPGFRTFRDLGLDEVALAVPLTLIGGIRVAALLINGNWRRSPELRIGGAVLGALIFGLISCAFGWPYLTGVGTASTAASTYSVLALSDVLSPYRSGADARLARI